jgi:two-component system, chemotaxis family, chemotaxis protein CheY
MSGSVLVVDDAATVRMYHRSILVEAGFSVVEAGNGYEGLELAIAGPFDLIVVDVNMPQMDGYEMVAAIRREGPNRATAILMVSTEIDPADEQRGYAAGATAYLGKPVAPDVLTSLACALAPPTP